MTGPCSGAGVGVARAGFAPLQYIGPAAIGGALASLSGWAGAGVGAAIGSLAYDLTTFCPGGPPAMPSFTIADIAALLSPIPTTARNTAAGKLSDFLGSVFWSQLCECATGAPVIAPLADYPAGGPQTTPVTPTNPNCEGLLNSNSTTGPWRSEDDPFILDVHAGDTINPAGYIRWPTSSPTSFLITLKNTTVIAPGASVSFRWEQRVVYSTGFTLGSPGAVLAPDTSQVVVVPALSGNTLLEIYVDAVTGTGTASLHGTMLEAFCNGDAPGGPQQPCCPPDAATQAQLDAILAMVTLIQRQAVPFGYVPGTAHAGLSGAGVIGITGLVGCKVDITTLPSQLGRRGDPLELFDAGFITFGTADGYPSAFRLERNPLLLLPPRASAYTDLSYDLHPGVVVTITELVREP